LIYREEPTIINDLEVSPTDPAAEYFASMGSLSAIPMFDKGLSLNMVVAMRKTRGALIRNDCRRTCG